MSSLPTSAIRIRCVPIGGAGIAVSLWTDIRPAGAVTTAPTRMLCAAAPRAAQGAAASARISRVVREAVVVAMEPKLGPGALFSHQLFRRETLRNRGCAV